ncbi:MAG TPA: aromatic ring-hydroxylating dioxygenase subunit alpha [Terriglobales bacterium]|nr:aromatic ring-hydroxylating dioxygenase subunit alpha [Terriglobales bacterium]
MDSGIQLEERQTAPVGEQSSSAGLMLSDFWYPALLSRELRGRKLLKTILLGLPVVVGRDANGRAFAMKDICPHRGIPLSCGRVEGENLECCYHGWKFNVHSGTCMEIPSLTADSRIKPEKIHATYYPCEERDGYVWVFMAESRNSAMSPPPVPELPLPSRKFKITHLSADLPCNVDHGVIGLMDPAHGPFVHQSWWWRTRRSIHEKQKTFEPIPYGFRIRTHTPSANSGAYKLLRFYGDAVTTSIEFTLPNIRVEQIRIGDHWVVNRAVVTPIAQGRCRLDFCAAWNIFSWVPLVKPIFNVFARKFIRQDQGTMELQAEGLRFNPPLMLIDDADRLGKWYFQLKAAYVRSKKTGLPFEHPMSGPVTLRWRS